MAQTTDLIRQRLTTELKASLLEIIDNSDAHAGHAGARQGGGHYSITIVSDAFEKKTLVQRHQMIYTALGEMMKNEIHALGINALTTSENN